MTNSTCFLRCLSFLVCISCIFASVNDEYNYYDYDNNPDGKDTKNKIVETKGPDQSLSLNLSRSDQRILHPEIKILILSDGDNRRGKVQENTFESWTPSSADIDAAEDVFLNEENVAAVRLAWDPVKKKYVVVNGVVNGKKIEDGNIETGGDDKPVLHSDFIDMGIKLTPPLFQDDSSFDTGVPPAIVEVLLVCDKEFGDKFNHDRRRILDYFTVYFWDINLRYKTLPSSNISFRITGIVIISTPSGQPFIEEARASDGRAEFGRILSRFSSWVYGQMSSLPKFDMAIAITGTHLEWGGGLAYFRTACHVDNNSKRHLGTLVWNDDGAWNSLTVGAHEIGHSVGAPHDDDGNFPGGCQDRGYIMSGGNDDLKWFFSTCSDRQIGEFVRSEQANCLRRLDETVQRPKISPDFSSVSAPSMEEQCKRRLNNPKAFIKEEETANCKVMKCWAPNDKGNGWLIWSFPPVDNSPCRGGGRCFRGRCRKTGSLLVNVGTGTCARAEDPFNFQKPVKLEPCPNPRSGATPLDKFIVEDAPSNGKWLQTPWSSENGKENGDRCVFTGNSEGGGLWTDRCNSENPWHVWEITEKRNNGEFLLRHRVTKRCAKAEGNNINTYSGCNSDDGTMRWKLE